MALQSVISLAVLVVVLDRVINILPSCRLRSAVLCPSSETAIRRTIVGHCRRLQRRELLGAEHMVEEVHPIGAMRWAGCRNRGEVESNVAFRRHRRSGGRAMSAAFKGVINIDI
jgi:hypothetical protein